MAGIKGITWRSSYGFDRENAVTLLGWMAGEYGSNFTLEQFDGKFHVVTTRKITKGMASQCHAFVKGFHAKNQTGENLCRGNIP
jgi:hypothetical protein